MGFWGPWVTVPVGPLSKLLRFSRSLKKNWSSICHFAPNVRRHPCLFRLLLCAHGCARGGREEKSVKTRVWKCHAADRNWFLSFSLLMDSCLLLSFTWSPLFNPPPLFLRRSQDYQRGIFQSIGFKEFHDYLTAPECSTQQEKDALRDKGGGQTADQIMNTNYFALTQLAAFASQCLNGIFTSDVTKVVSICSILVSIWLSILLQFLNKMFL